MDGAELYMLLIRASMVPVVGEAIPTPFQGQIVLDGWSWNFNNQEEANRVKKVEDKDAKHRTALQKKAAIDKINRDSSLSEAEKVAAMTKLNMAEVADQLKEEAAERDKKAKEQNKDETEEDKDDESLTFSFTKGLDAASTQMLNGMKSGEVFPRAVITLFDRRKATPMTLTVTIKNLRLTSFDFSCSPSGETSTSFKETWESVFEEIDYAYQSRPSVGPVDASAASATRMATKGQVRIFKMMPKSLRRKSLF
jgi:type VI protein secretion system component Hcp